MRLYIDFYTFFIFIYCLIRHFSQVRRSRALCALSRNFRRLFQ